MRNVPVKEQKIEKCNGNFIRIHQHAFLTAEFISVHKSAVDTAEIPNPGLPVFRNPDFGMVAGNHIIPDNDVVLLCGTDSDQTLLQTDHFPFTRPVQSLQAMNVAWTAALTSAGLTKSSQSPIATRSFSLSTQPDTARP